MTLAKAFSSSGAVCTAEWGMADCSSPSPLWLQNSKASGTFSGTVRLTLGSSTGLALDRGRVNSSVSALPSQGLRKKHTHKGHQGDREAQKL